MKILKRKNVFVCIFLLLIIVFLSGFMGCKNKNDENETKKEVFSFQVKEISICVGETYNAYVDSTFGNYVYFITDSDCISVSDLGIVYGLKAGTAEIVATDGIHSDTMRVTVTGVYNLVLELKTSNLYVGQSIGFDTYVVEDGEKVQNQPQITIESDNQTVVEINQNNRMITAKSVGEVTLTVSTVFGGQNLTATKKLLVCAMDENCTFYYQGEPLEDILVLREGEELANVFSMRIVNENGVTFYNLLFKGATQVNGNTYNASYALLDGGAEIGTTEIVIFEPTERRDLVDEQGKILYNATAKIFVGNTQIDGKNKNLLLESTQLFLQPRNSLYVFDSMGVGEFVRSFSAIGDSKLSISKEFTYVNRATLCMNTNSALYPRVSFTDLFDNRLDYNIKAGDKLSFRIYLDKEDKGTTEAKISAWSDGNEKIIINKGEVPYNEWIDITLPISSGAFDGPTPGFIVCVTSFEDMTASATPMDYNVYFADFCLIKSDFLVNAEENYVVEPNSSFSLDFLSVSDGYGYKKDFTARVFNTEDGSVCEIKDNAFTVESKGNYIVILDIENAHTCFYVSASNAQRKANLLYPELLTANEFVGQYEPFGNSKIETSYDKLYNGRPTLKINGNNQSYPGVYFTGLSNNYGEYGIKKDVYIQFKLYIESNIDANKFVTNENFINGTWLERTFGTNTLTTGEWITMNFRIGERAVNNLATHPLEFIVYPVGELFDGAFYLADICIIDYENVYVSERVNAAAGKMLDVQTILPSEYRGTCDLTLEVKDEGGTSVSLSKDGFLVEEGKEYYVTVTIGLGKNNSSVTIVRQIKITAVDKTSISTDSYWTDWF